MRSSLLSAIILSTVTGAMGRTFTVSNACPFTIWWGFISPSREVYHAESKCFYTTSRPALFTDLNVGNVAPGQPTGYARSLAQLHIVGLTLDDSWESLPFTSVQFYVPDNWKAGRIWARRDCDFATNSGPNSCLDGGCNGGLLCDPRTGTGVPPATIAEFNLDAAQGLDFYDVSLVDGYNLPMRVDNDKGCPVPSCSVDLGPNCPTPLKGPFGSNGFPVGCKSACAAGLSPDQSNSPNCCTGSYNTAQTCLTSHVAYYSYFKSQCPNSYVYAYDESSGTALFTCPSSKNADYTITFCP